MYDEGTRTGNTSLEMRPVVMMAVTFGNSACCRPCERVQRKEDASRPE